MTKRVTVQDALNVKLGPNQGSMAVLGANGHTNLVWDRTKEEEVEGARDMFSAIKNEGYMAYKLEGQDGRKGEVISEFDPNAERIVLTPPLQGGA